MNRMPGFPGEPGRVTALPKHRVFNFDLRRRLLGLHLVAGLRGDELRGLHLNESVHGRERLREKTQAIDEKSDNKVQHRASSVSARALDVQSVESSKISLEPDPRLTFTLAGRL